MVPLVKEKNEDERICSLDGLRGLAALAVVAFHYTGGGLHRLLPGGQFVTPVLHPERARALHRPAARRDRLIRLAALPAAPHCQARRPHLLRRRGLLHRLHRHRAHGPGGTGVCGHVRRVPAVRMVA